MKYAWILPLLWCGLAQANSLGPVFALQQSPGIQPSYLNASNVRMGDDPLLSPTLITHYLTGNYLAFVSTIEPLVGPMDVTLTIAGQTYTTGAFVNGVSSCVNSFVLPRTFYHPTPGLLTLHFGDDTQTYAFQFIEPVPEPATIVLTGLGLVLLSLRKRGL